MSVSGPKSVFGDESAHQEVIDRVIRTANVIEVNVNMADRSSGIIDNADQYP